MLLITDYFNKLKINKNLEESASRKKKSPKSYLAAASSFSKPALVKS